MAACRKQSQPDSNNEDGLVFMAQLPLGSRQLENQSNIHSNTPTHTHTAYLKSHVRRSRSGNAAEIVSRPLRTGIEQ